MPDSVASTLRPRQFQSEDLYKDLYSSHTRSEEITPIEEGTSPELKSAGLPPLQCEYEGCFQTFTGTHRRGTLHRHMRLKHSAHDFSPEKSFPCEASGCRKVFKRQDARLKHHRKKHPELGVAAATPRKDKQSS